MGKVSFDCYLLIMVLDKSGYQENIFLILPLWYSGEASCLDVSIVYMFSWRNEKNINTFCFNP